MTKERVVKLGATGELVLHLTGNTAKAAPPLTHQLRGVADRPSQVEDMAPDDPRVIRALQQAVARSTNSLER